MTVYNNSMKDPDVRNTIREMYYSQGMSSGTIGTLVGVPARTIRDYISGNTWSGEGKLRYNPEDVKLAPPKDEAAILFIGLNEQDRNKLIEDVNVGNYIFKTANGDSMELDQVYNDRLTLRTIKLKIEPDNSRILLISDLHVPYHHPDTLEFLQYLVDKYEPTRVICLGDELDKHALSFHDSDPNLPSAGDELKLSLPVIKRLKEMFPVMDILESNHGSLLYRKAHHHGIPKEYLKSYNDVLGVDDGWKWHYDMVLDLPDGNKCYLHHGKSANVTKTSQTMSMCAIQGHFHETFKVEYWGNPVSLYWAMQCGCLINDKSYAFNYNNVNLKRPIIGTGLIINSQPVLEPMVLDKNGRWVLRK